MTMDWSAYPAKTVKPHILNPVEQHFTVIVSNDVVQPETHSVHSVTEETAASQDTVHETTGLSQQEEETTKSEELAEEQKSTDVDSANVTDGKTDTKTTTTIGSEKEAIFKSFFNKIFNLLEDTELSQPLKQRLKLNHGKPVIDKVIFFRNPEVRLSENDLYSFMDFPHEFLTSLTVQHNNFIDGIPSSVPNELYSGNGYVIVGGGIYTWYSVLAIEALRGLKSEYPIEVFLPNEDDYEPELCEVVLPRLNAKCVQMDEVFGKETLSKFRFGGYQYKSLALLASSFENAFLLDADAYPVKNPDVLFNSELFEKYPMITWPDFWRRTGSPHFYKVAGKEVGNEPIRHLNDIFVDPKFINHDDESGSALSMTFHDRRGTLAEWSTESGEMLVNKKFHFKSLLLSLYYNYNGPYGYYPLLSQGGPGEGDKETFVAGANYFDLPYYQVNKSPDTAYGWYNVNDKYEHTTIVQFDPIKDHEILQEVKQKIEQDMNEHGDNFKYNYNDYFPQFFHSNNGIPMIYHVHDPKMNPFYIVEKGTTYNKHGVKIRNLGEDFPRTNFDLELTLWKAIDKHLCKDKVNFNAFKDKDMGVLCDGFTEEQLSFLKEGAGEIWQDYQPDRATAQRSGKEYDRRTNP